ncbi:N-acetylglucosaminyl deacetylase, LmbE family [Sphingobium faniae]|nr:N-acetylglucosaminyl deacetylase, LmbE family [Sphingobium faniae]
MRSASGIQYFCVFMIIMIIASECLYYNIIESRWRFPVLSMINIAFLTCAFIYGHVFMNALGSDLSFRSDLFSHTAIAFSVVTMAGIGFRYNRGRQAAPAPTKAILAIGAHPDDVEFGCGAALLHYRKQGFATHALILSSGENGLGASPTPLHNSRRREAHKGGEVMRLSSLTILNFPDCGMTSRRDGIKSAIEEAIRKYNPDVVFTHNNFDRHSDHRMVFNATVEACRNVPTVLCYENPNTPPEFRPNFFVDVSDCLDFKIRALQCHSSQTRKSYFKPELIRSIARVRGNQAKVRFAEGFIAIRAVLGAM